MFGEVVLFFVSHPESAKVLFELLVFIFFWCDVFLLLCVSFSIDRKE